MNFTHVSRQPGARARVTYQLPVLVDSNDSSSNPGPSNSGLPSSSHRSNDRVDAAAPAMATAPEGEEAISIAVEVEACATAGMGSGSTGHIQQLPTEHSRDNRTHEEKMATLEWVRPSLVPFSFRESRLIHQLFFSQCVPVPGTKSNG
jgi:hypothetical protein